MLVSGRVINPIWRAYVLDGLKPPSSFVESILLEGQWMSVIRVLTQPMAKQFFQNFWEDYIPGDSKWPFYPLVGGHLTFETVT